ncbi:hypothetical protein HK103_005179 [Boothiomyces macroporosus]|uniref:Vesicle transport protein USE1 n=1 Tax=Boothiomyces macroporosus TaxID=261099 RepID=A0AAD5Y3G0_9FUNG|nr:hypothetical protein HK103_005179 [Boothiomyces macroporosus]
MLSTSECKSLLKYLQTKPIKTKHEEQKLKSTLAYLETVLPEDLGVIRELKNKISEPKEPQVRKQTIEERLGMNISPERIELLKQVKFKGMKPTLAQKKKELLKDQIVMDKSEEELTEILAQQSKQLLNSTLQFNQKLKEDKEHLDSLDNKIQDTTAKVQSSRKGMKEITKSTWTTTIMIWISVLLAILVMAWMLIYMRLVSPSKVKYVKETITATIETTATPVVDHNEL